MSKLFFKDKIILETKLSKTNKYKVSLLIKKAALKAKKFQSGFIYQYAFVMLIGFSALLTFLIVK